MSRFIDAVKAGARAFGESLGPGPYAIAGKQVECTHCAGRNFSLLSVSPSEVGEMYVPIVGFVLTCEACSRVELFRLAPMRMSTEPPLSR